MGTSSPLIFPDENPSVPEEVPPPPVPGIAPPPMGPLPNVAPSTSRRSGPQLQPIGITPSGMNPERERGSSPPLGAGNIGAVSSPVTTQEEPTAAAPDAARESTRTRTIPKSKAGGWPWERQVGRRLPPPQLTPGDASEVEPAGYSGAEPGGQPAAQAIYR